MLVIANVLHLCYIGDMGTAIIILVLIAIIAGAISSIRKRIKYGSSCCGTHDAAPSKIRVRDKNKSHYPYSYTLNIDGMHCANCSRRVENALNAKEGIWATVNLSNNSALVRSKIQLQWTELSKIIGEAGYTLISLSEN